ncbi:MAG TPA: hypothetical protein VH413_16175 [Verrucomicrobiae bacterium]|jgi:hypothetical protein|nr:hypothetical protein [Verrucomicrobiae bacterium]
MSTTRQTLEQIMTEAAAKLAEHADSVLIIVTYRDDDDDMATAALSTRKGNVFAATESARDFLRRTDIKNDFALRKSLENNEP